VVSADGVHDVDLAALIARHQQSGAAATVTVKRIARPETCAIVELDPRAMVQRFVEKPAAGEVFTDLASIGIYCFRADMLEAIPLERPFDIAGDLIPLLLGRGDLVAAYETDAWWSDVGDPGELLAANLELAGAVVGPHARVGEGAVVRRGLVLPGAEVPAGAVVEDRIHGTGDDVLRTWLR
jgi:NDP-sugar pyrophosphorylase family protein